MRRLPHLIRRNRVWFAVLTVPADVRPILGRSRFERTTRETDEAKAYVIALPWVQDWKAKIQQSRVTRSDPVRDEVARILDQYRKANPDSMNQEIAEMIEGTIAGIIEQMGGVSPEQWAKEVAAGAERRQGRTAGGSANVPLAFAGAVPVAGTPFAAHLDAFRTTTHLKGKALAMVLGDLETFSKAVPVSLESLTGRHVQEWIDGLLRPKTGDGVKAATINHKLASMRAYWSWLQSRELVVESFRPFNGRKVSDGRNGAEQADDDRIAFTAAEVVRLWQAADANHDHQLAAAIRIGAYTGIRRDGVCTLKIDSIVTDEETGIRCFQVSEKTRAGRRLIPIHCDLASLVDALVSKADRDGHLIHDAGVDTFGYRGVAIGTRFSELKGALGFDERHVYHCLRHTFQNLLEAANVSLKVRKNLMGHKVADITEGHGRGKYGAISPLTDRRDAIEKLSFPTV